MKAKFIGYTEANKNAMFAVERIYNGYVISEKHFELKDGLNADQFVIGREYEVENIIK